MIIILSHDSFFNSTLFILVGLDTIPKKGVNISLPPSSSNIIFSSVICLFSFLGLYFSFQEF